VRQLAADVAVPIADTGIEQQHVFSGVHQQRLNAELKVVGGSPSRLEHRADRLVRLAEHETLAVDGHLKRAVFERHSAIAANLESLKLRDGSCGSGSGRRGLRVYAGQ